MEAILSFLLVLLSVAIMQFLIIKSEIYINTNNSIKILRSSVMLIMFIWASMFVSDFLREQFQFQWMDLAKAYILVTFEIADIIIIYEYIVGGDEKSIILITILETFYNLIITSVMTTLVINNKLIEKSTAEIESFWQFAHGVEYILYGFISLLMVIVTNLILYITVKIVKARTGRDD